MNPMTSESIILKMMEIDKGDPARIQHFIKVYQFAHTIGMQEGLDAATMRILDTAAILHDIAIVPVEKKLGYCNGKLQEEEGPAYARALLEEVGSFSINEIDRICYLIGHHHTYTDVDGLDYRILLEADFLVNAFEEGLKEEAILKGEELIFQTTCGKKMLHLMFKLGIE